jgi:hypothetical protein
MAHHTKGTFSSVYVATDVDHHKFKNDWCLRFSLNLIDFRHVPEDSVKGKNSMCGKVALKRIYATSAPIRIHTELNLLKELRLDLDLIPEETLSLLRLLLLYVTKIRWSPSCPILNTTTSKYRKLSYIVEILFEHVERSYL